jgi:hypothetical protein
MGANLRLEIRLASIFHKPWKRHHSVFAPHLSPTLLRAASQAALQRENLTSAWACEIFGLAGLPKRVLLPQPSHRSLHAF